MSQCRIEGCPNAAVAKQLCAMHYMRVLRTGDAIGRHNPGPKPKPSGMALLLAEIAWIKAENDELRRRRGREVADLRRQLKAKVMYAPPRSESEAVAELERQLKAARTRIKNLMAEAEALARSKANHSTISEAHLRKLQIALHPDSDATASAARKLQLNEAFLIFNAIKFQVRDD